MMRITLLFLSVLIQQVFSEPATDVRDAPGIVELGDFEILQLPSDFDPNHAALDIASQSEALRRNPHAALPHLPAHILASAIKIQGSTLTRRSAEHTDSEDHDGQHHHIDAIGPTNTGVQINPSAILKRLTFHCHRDGGREGADRPHWWDVDDLGMKLESDQGLGNQFCCHFNYRDFRTTIMTHNTAAVEWAGIVGRCMSCRVIGYIIRVHTELCGVENSYFAGGMVVYVIPILPLLRPLRLARYSELILMLVCGVSSFHGWAEYNIFRPKEVIHE